MKITLLCTAVLLSVESFGDFLDAYCPFSIDGQKITVDHPSGIFEMEFSKDGLLMDGEKSSLGSFVARVAQGDLSVFSDWNAHAQVFLFALAAEGAEEFELTHVGTMNQEAFINTLFGDRAEYARYLIMSQCADFKINNIVGKWNPAILAHDLYATI